MSIDCPHDIKPYPQRKNPIYLVAVSVISHGNGNKTKTFNANKANKIDKKKCGQNNVDFELPFVWGLCVTLGKGSPRRRLR